MSFLSPKHRPPLITALLIQGVVFAALYLLGPYLELALGQTIPLFWKMVAQGLLAGAITALFGLTWVWISVQILAPPLLILGIALNLPNWVFPAALALLVLVFWNVASNRVPLYLTNLTTAKAIRDLLPSKKGLHVVDLGSGLGGTLRYLARESATQKFTGLESAPIPFALSWAMGKLTGCRNLHFRMKNIWAQPLGDYDVVYCFLSPVPMARLYEKAQEELKPGSLFISNSFEVPDHTPDQVIEVNDRRKTRLLVWKM